MRFSLLPLLPLASAAIAPDMFNWAAGVLDGSSAPAPVQKPIHTFDSWKWSDCGEYEV